MRSFDWITLRLLLNSRQFITNPEDLVALSATSKLGRQLVFLVVLSDGWADCSE